MTYQPDFSGCWAKIERAWEHRNALNAEILPHLLAERYSIPLSAEFDHQSGYYIFRVAALPEDELLRFGVVAGDCVHSLRCVLDHLVWQLTRVKSGGPELTGSGARRARFPISVQTPSGNIVPEEFAKGDALKDVLPSHRAKIEGLQPYHAPDPAEDFLAILRDLSDTDKHRVVNEVLVFTRNFTLTGGAFDSIPATGVKAFGKQHYLKVGTEVAHAAFPRDPDNEVEVAGYAALEIALPQNDESVVRGLDFISAHVTNIVREFEQLF